MGLSTMQRAPRWSMLGKPRSDSTDRRTPVPDPGSYNRPDPAQTSKMARSPNGNFGSCTSSRQVLDRIKESRTPGPGQYQTAVRDDLGQVPRQTSATISTPRTRDRQVRDTTPDPGSYMAVRPESTSKMGRSSSAGFASSRVSRFPQLKERAPGPGAYASRREIGNSSSQAFMNSPRQRARAIEVAPDPGSYMPADPGMTSRMIRSPRSLLDSRSSTGRLLENGENGERQPRNAVPGPGTYGYKEFVGDEAPAAVFQRAAERFPERLLSKARAETPDPGAYAAVEPSATSKFEMEGGRGFGGLNTGRNDLPVPAILDRNGTVNEKFNGVNGFTLRSPRGSLGPKRDIPGPGAYEVVYSAQAIDTASPRWGFQSAEARPSLMAASRAATLQPTPGPANYVSNTTVGIGPKFSIRARVDERRESTPGPGSYGGHYTQFI